MIVHTQCDESEIVQLFCNQKFELPYADKIQNQIKCMINKALKSLSKKTKPSNH